MLRAVLGLAAMAPAFAQDGQDPSFPVLTGTNDVPVYAEYDKKVRTAEQVSPLASDLFGDVVSPYAGQTEFDNVDIDLPGNNALPVQLRRRFVISTLTENQLPNDFGGRSNSYVGMGNWDIDVPYIYGVFDLQIGWDTALNAGTPRCSTYFQPGTPGALDGYIWSGNKVRIPGKGEREMIRFSTNYPPTHGLSAMKNPQWTTREFDAFRCVPIANGTGYGEGFVMITSDGTSYYFDQYYSRRYPGVSFGNKRAGRKMVFLLASKVVDRYGNSVSYQYNDNGHPEVISSSDGRTITLTYDSTNSSLLSTASATSPTSPARTWRYGYEWTQRDGARLTSVTLPDNNLLPNNVAKWQYDYTSLNPNDEYLYAAYTAVDDGELTCSGSTFEGGNFKFKITHPSGAQGTFKFQLSRFYRGMPTTGVPNCTPGPDGNRIYAKPPYIDSFAIKEKTVTDTAASAWQYLYRTSGLCINNNCDTVKNRIVQPDGSAIDSTYSARFNATGGSVPAGSAIEGSLLKTEYWRVAGDTDPLRTEDYLYVTGPDVSNQPFTGYSFASRYGSGGAAEDPASASIRPLKKVTVTQQGATFVRDIQSFDDYARPVTVQMSSSLNGARSETTTYLDDTTGWVLGLVDSRTSPSFASPIVKNYYDSKRNLTSVEEFGVLKRSMTYRTDGTLLTVNDGLNTTTLGTFKRGIPQSVTYADGNSQSASVSDFGEILSVTDENGYMTTYEYDPLSRLKRIIYPSGDNNGTGWNVTLLDYAFVATDPAVGLSSPHWRQTRTTGQGKKITYFDQLLRPVVTEEYDAANRTGTLRYTLRRFDYANRETFVSYPSPTFAPTAGTTTQYDMLGRVLQVTQDSELGALTTQTSYLPPFKKQVIDPKNNVTTTEFYAYDTPSEDAPRKITAPQGVTIDIARDTLDKPLSVKRSGNYAGSAVSQTRNYVYDAGQRLCKTIEPESGATIQDYDAAGNVSWSVKGSLLLSNTNCNRADVPSADRTVYSYDARNRPRNTTFPSGTSPIAQTYWPDGALKTIASNGAIWEYDYNKRGLLVSETLSYDSQQFLLEWGYDANGSVSQLMYPDDSIVSFAPNALGQPTRAGSYATGVTYYANGAIKGFTYGNNVVHSLTQNTRQLPGRSKDGTVTDLTYTYDKNANVTAIADGAQAGLESRTMSYDGLDRLSTANASSLWGNATFGYDPLDNMRTSAVGIRSCTHAYSVSFNRLTSVSGTNCPAMNYTYDARGNVTARGTQGFVFDRADRLTAATGKQTYAYDGLGRRVSVAPADGSGALYQIYSKEGQLLFGWDSATDKSTNYIYLNNSLIARQEIGAGGNAPPSPDPIQVSPNPSTNGIYAVTWTAVAGADTYVLKQRINDGEETTVYTGGQTSWATGGKPTSSYTYRAQACMGGVCGSFSASVIENVQLPPTTAPNINVGPNPSSDGSFTVTWTSVSAATTYALEEQVNGGFWNAVSTGSSGLSWSTTDRPDGSYAYRVHGCNLTCGPYSVVVTEVVQRTQPPPEAPSTISASPSTSTDGSYTVTWGAVSNVVNYALEEKIGNAGWVELPRVSGTSKPFSGRSNGVYAYRVRACNANCSNSYSPTATVTVSIPDTPGTAGPITSNQNPSIDGGYTLSWPPVSQATRYQLEQSSSSNPGVWSTVSNGSNTSWPKTGQPDGSYSYRVRACNTVCGTPSTAYTQIVRRTPPPPINFQAGPNPSTGHYTVSWDESPGAEFYWLYESVNGATPALVNTNGTQHSIEFDRGNGSYSYQVKACAIIGQVRCSPLAGPVSVTVQASQIPAAPEWTTYPPLVCRGPSRSYTIGWSVVPDATSYDLHETSSDSVPPIDQIFTGTSTSQSFTRSRGGSGLDTVNFNYEARACTGSGSSRRCSQWNRPVLSICVGIIRGPETSAASGVTYIHTDGLRSPVAETNATGAVTSRMRYEPYGAPTTGTQAQGPGYTGHVWDAATGLSYMQQRYYDPLAGRFLSTDPVAASAGSFNRYWYANNNSYRYIDPDGRETFDCRGKSACANEIKISDLKQGDVVKTNGATVSVGKNDIKVTFAKGVEKGSVAARTGPVIIPSGPPGADVDKNMKQASSMSAIDFRNQVKNKGPWDYKQQGREYEEFGNFNYGATGRSAGFPGGTLLQQAGRAQMAAGTSRSEWGEPGGWLPGTGSGNNGDDPLDQFWIQQGIRYEGK